MTIKSLADNILHFPVTIPANVFSLLEIEKHFRTENLPRNQHFYGGENSGRKRIDEYIWQRDLVKDYKETRNGLLGMDYSSKFSPWLSLGCLSARQIYWELKRYEGLRVKNESTYWLWFELLWRDYFHFTGLKEGARIFRPEGYNEKHPKMVKGPNEPGFTSWINGKTNDPFVNANMKELRHTGFMSNRGRQNVASYLIHELNCCWTLGAMYFESMLIDYDVFSNWGNWAYLAGVGRDPRESRKFNTILQAQKYDPDGVYTTYWNHFV